MTLRDCHARLTRTCAAAFLVLLASVAIASVAHAETFEPLAVIRLAPAHTDVPVPPISDAQLEVKAAVWVRNEQFVAAVIATRGSDSPKHISVALWDTATGRLEDWIALPYEFLSQDIYVRALALYDVVWSAKSNTEFAVALALTTTTGPGECGNVLLYSNFGPDDASWRPDTDANTPAVCSPGEAAVQTSPSGKLALKSRGTGLVIRGRASHRLVLEIPDELAGEHPSAQVHGIGDALSRSLPKIVLQTMSSAEAPKRAIWSADGQRVVALVGSLGSDAARDMAFLVWDPWRGDIVKRVSLPPSLGATDLLVHEFRIDAKTDIEIRGSVRTKAGGCKSTLLEYSLTRFIRMNARYDLNRAENCQHTGSPEAISPNGKYAIDLGEGRLAVREIASGERVAVLEKPEALLLAAASLSPDGKSIALVGERATGGERSLMLLQLESARFSASPLPPRDDSGEAIVWQDSGRPVVVGQRDAATSAAPDGAGATAPPAPAGASHRRLLATSDGVRRLEYDPATQSVEHVVLLDGVETREQLFQNVVAAGALPDAPMAWIATRNAGLYWIDRNDLYYGPSQAPVTYFLPDGKFFAQGKNAYDTNLPADTDLFRWAVDGDGLNSLGPQTYMRLSFEPQLIHKQIVCAQTPGCSGLRRSGTAQVNGALPEVAIETVNAGSRPNTADVVIAVKQGQRTDSRGRTQTSGAFNLRLFRNGALVAQYPAVEESENPDVTAWRERNRVALGPDLTARIPLTISLPTAARPQDIELSAYAFNDDRVKSETSRIRFPVPAAAAPRPRRAFVVNIGIDDYDEKRLKLQFAASDARLLGSQLATIPGYTVHRVTLAGPAGRGGSVRVTAAMIAQAIGILAGRDVAASKNALKRQGVDASQLYASTPDDIVILSFSGHGWADETGAFYLVPAEGRWPGGPEPDRSTLISAVQMADRLREVDAAEMVMIIDACHSAASVDSGGFKPGPMGDPGLGQLAFDKGIRILAATQADDVAMEDPVLGQGLLTYALAGEGITATGGKADGDGDGRITLDEWLRYATRRMPSLGTDVRLGRLSTDASGARGWVRASAQNPPPIQEPSLFDFNTSPSKVVLRQGVGR